MPPKGTCLPFVSLLPFWSRSGSKQLKDPSVTEFSPFRRSRRTGRNPQPTGTRDFFVRSVGVTGLTIALSASLLGSAPTALAVEDPYAPAFRSQVVEIWEVGGTGIKEAAEQALLGSDEDIRQFLNDMPTIQQMDSRVDVSRVVNVGGPAVRDAAKAALRGTPEDVENFLDSGWQAPQEQDRRVEASRVVHFGGPGVQDAGKAALLGTPEDVKQFLEAGQYKAQETDERVEVSKLYNSGGMNVKAAAKLALRGTPEDVVEFLEVGQFVARNRDQEYATIAQLTKQAETAGKQAEQATERAQEASAKATAAAELAQAAAEKAAKETEAAKEDAARASVKAKQAADAARAAAAAAQQAIGAANAANASARRASLAAAQTASAAAAAAEAAGRASNAAYAASQDKDKAQAALDQAAEARKAGELAKRSAKAAEQASRAALAAADAVAASRSATGNANKAADAADQAADYAAAAGGSSAEARAAAAETRRHANEANRAASASEALARKSAAAATEARNAANSAATHAENAAEQAEKAAEHAGEAADQAAEATKQAAAAKVAADVATKAVVTAQKTFSTAREIETEDLATRTNAGVEAALTQKTSADTFTIEISKSVIEGQTIVDDTKALAAESQEPGADQAAIADKGRRVALRAMKHFGSWRQDAAAQALSGTNADVIAYLNTGWSKAAADETRQQVADLASSSPYEAVRAAAAQALNGTDQQILSFYTTGQHEAANADYRVSVSKLFNDGGPGVKDAAKKALEDGSATALLRFLNSGQHEARQADSRVTASKLYNDGGPEVKSEAKIALAGSASEVNTFVEAGQYMADRKDQLAYNHIAQVERLLSEGQGIAANARRNSYLAAQSAAEALGAAADAEKAKKAAAQSAVDAKGHADAADAAANRAETSATQAKASASTARAAANRADQDAAAAEESASEAEFSADYARASATAATQSSEDARQSALDAGKSAAEADKVAKAAWKDAVEKREKELAEQSRLAAEARKKQREEEKRPPCYLHPTRDHLPPCALNGGKLDHPPIDPVLKEFAWEVLGLNDAKECAKNPSLGKCALAALSVSPLGKAKLVKKGAEAIEDIADASRTAKVIKCATCFLAGTAVLMADGNRQAIETLEIGDQVTATDPLTGRTEARTVEALIITGMDRSFNDLSIGTSHGIERLTATHEHPFWSPSERGWVEAGNLRPGMSLRTVDGSSATVEKNRSYTDRARTYNLTVDGLHTYYVYAGNTPLLVHNDVCGVRVSPVASDWATKGAHLHVGADEVHVFSHEGGLGAKGIRLKTGMASDKSVQKVLDTLKSSPEIRRDVIQKARAAQEHMNTHNWGNNKNRAVELQFLIKALEKLG